MTKKTKAALMRASFCTILMEANKNLEITAQRGTCKQLLGNEVELRIFVLRVGEKSSRLRLLPALNLRY